MVLNLMNQSLIIDAAIIVNYYLILLKCFIYNQWLKERVWVVFNLKPNKA